MDDCLKMGFNPPDSGCAGTKSNTFD